MAPTSEPGSGKPTNAAHLTLEAWSQGMMVGSLVTMAMITAANMRAGVLLHKLVLLEVRMERNFDSALSRNQDTLFLFGPFSEESRLTQRSLKLVLAIPNGFFIFFNAPVFGWYLSSTAVLLITSWGLHNVIAWIKNKPFLSQTTSRIYIGTVALVQAYWVVEIYANFAYFNNINERLFVRTRPYEALCRDPWWIFTTVNLLWNIKHRYNLGFLTIIRVSPRFGILLLSMCLSVAFIVVDILSVTSVLDTGSINPFWKFSFVFKCFTDTIILDDFKTALDKLWQHGKNSIVVGNVHRENKIVPVVEQLELQRRAEIRCLSFSDPLEGNVIMMTRLGSRAGGENEV
ncbi:hypothetical protein PV08_05357 [Exophiala spinifera]|uniref:Uncharacterized protein n=1 Tax=Exophiala spinifera TaxID=91928 RepID=A0A0D1ZR76_9EURO|nr:uncharacterized protein PV08_05357 [Exophiala spinifera]KIW15312.1 hypothetical protein PV08_05357 [Exophiala spinifera]